jgi:hypothetical protein
MKKKLYTRPVLVVLSIEMFQQIKAITDYFAIARILPMIASVTSLVFAVPPKSGVSTRPSAVTALIAESINFAVFL